MADLATQKVQAAGSVPTLAPATVSGDRMVWSPTGFLKVSNASGGPINVTLNSIRACDQGFDHDTVVAVAAGATKDISIKDPRFRDSSGWVNITYSAVTSVTVGAFEA